MPVPYNMDFELFVMQNSDDALQVQIQPAVTLNDNSTDDDFGFNETT